MWVTVHFEVVGLRKKGVRKGHTKEEGPSSLALLSHVLRFFLRITSKRLLRRLKIGHLLVKMASLKFWYKEKILRMYNEIMGKTFWEDLIRILNVFMGRKISMIGEMPKFP